MKNFNFTFFLLLLLHCSSPYLHVPSYQPWKGTSCIEELIKDKNVNFIINKNEIYVDIHDLNKLVSSKEKVKIHIKIKDNMLKDKKIYYHIYLKDLKGGSSYLQSSNELKLTKLPENGYITEIVTADVNFGEEERGIGHTYQLTISLNCAHVQHVKPDQIFNEDFEYEIIRQSREFIRKSCI
ncbi:MAG: hypothetical protein IPQ05_15505 [Leptospiraceae bacterium]|nr:hypothetical protein [Leptospiraceae bacterium]MBL0265224.1 hypothetical protein [Leptospiraceae bacterium]